MHISKKLLLMFTIVVLTGLCPVINANAHEIRPGLLDIKERETGWFEILWKVPTRGEEPLAIVPILPDSLQLLGLPSVERVPGARVERAAYKSNGEPLTGKTIVIDGLSAQQTDVMLNIELKSGIMYSAILRPGSPEFTIPLAPSRFEVAGSYWRMGTTHILEGIDHLLFVLALMLLVSGHWKLFRTITAFTIAHSISLGLATLGFINMPSRPTEAVIALSIMFLAVEIIHSRQGKISLTEKYPWMIAFVFGLFHGLGFAGALTEIGLPQSAIPLALLMFNVGVESGQLLFIFTVLIALFVLKKLKLTPATPWVYKFPPYAIGSVAAFWCIQRVSAFFLI